MEAQATNQWKHRLLLMEAESDPIYITNNTNDNTEKSELELQTDELLMKLNIA